MPPELRSALMSRIRATTFVTNRNFCFMEKKLEKLASRFVRFFVVYRGMKNNDS